MKKSTTDNRKTRRCLYIHSQAFLLYLLYTALFSARGTTVTEKSSLKRNIKMLLTH
jgi:hypothetical protein